MNAKKGTKDTAPDLAPAEEERPAGGTATDDGGRPMVDDGGRVVVLDPRPDQDADQ